jgi:hypothetical protein
MSELLVLALGEFRESLPSLYGATPIPPRLPARRRIR